MPPKKKKANAFQRLNSDLPAGVANNANGARSIRADADRKAERARVAEKHRLAAERSIHDDEELNDPWSQKTVIGASPSEIIAAGEIATAGYGAGKAVVGAVGKRAARLAAEKAAEKAAKSEVFQAARPRGVPGTGAAPRPKPTFSKPTPKPAPKPVPKPASSATLPRTGRVSVPVGKNLNLRGRLKP